MCVCGSTYLYLYVCAQLPVCMYCVCGWGGLDGTPTCICMCEKLFVDTPVHVWRQGRGPEAIPTCICSCVNNYLCVCVCPVCVGTPECLCTPVFVCRGEAHTCICTCVHNCLCVCVGRGGEGGRHLFVCGFFLGRRGEGGTYLCMYVCMYVQKKSSVCVRERERAVISPAGINRMKKESYLFYARISCVETKKKRENRWGSSRYFYTVFRKWHSLLFSFFSHPKFVWNVYVTVCTCVHVCGCVSN